MTHSDQHRSQTSPIDPADGDAMAPGSQQPEPTAVPDHGHPQTTHAEPTGPGSSSDSDEGHEAAGRSATS